MEGPGVSRWAGLWFPSIPSPIPSASLCASRPLGPCHVGAGLGRSGPAERCPLTVWPCPVMAPHRAGAQEHTASPTEEQGGDRWGPRQACPGTGLKWGSRHGQGSWHGGISEQGLGSSRWRGHLCGGSENGNPLGGTGGPTQPWLALPGCCWHALSQDHVGSGSCWHGPPGHVHGCLPAPTLQTGLAPGPGDWGPCLTPRAGEGWDPRGHSDGMTMQWPWTPHGTAIGRQAQRGSSQLRGTWEAKLGLIPPFPAPLLGCVPVHRPDTPGIGMWAFCRPQPLPRGPTPHKAPTSPAPGLDSLP